MNVETAQNELKIWKRGSVFCINHSKTTPRYCQLCSNDTQQHPRVEIAQWTASLCCLSDVVDSVQIGLSLYADH